MRISKICIVTAFPYVDYQKQSKNPVTVDLWSSHYFGKKLVLRNLRLSITSRKELRSTNFFYQSVGWNKARRMAPPSVPYELFRVEKKNFNSLLCLNQYRTRTHHISPRHQWHHDPNCLACYRATCAGTAASWQAPQTSLVPPTMTPTVVLLLVWIVITITQILKCGDFFLPQWLLCNLQFQRMLEFSFPPLPEYILKYVPAQFLFLQKHWHKGINDVHDWIAKFAFCTVYVGSANSERPCNSVGK